MRVVGQADGDGAVGPALDHHSQRRPLPRRQLFDGRVAQQAVQRGRAYGWGRARAAENSAKASAPGVS